MSALAISAHIGGVCARTWWRKTTARLGVVGAAAVIAAIPAAIALFHWWAWGRVAGVIRELVGGGQAARIVLPSLVLSFVMICVVLRAALLAFDFVSPDLRLIMYTAPLTRRAKAIVQVGPDALVSAVLALGVGSLGMTAYAAASDRVGLVPMLLVCLGCVAFAGALTSVIELILTRMLRDGVASRAGAAVISLLMMCAGLFGITRAVQSRGADIPLLGAVGGLLDRGNLVVTLLGLALTAISLLVWGWADSRVAPELLRARHATPLLKVPGGRIGFASAATFWRDASNRVGAVGMLAICLFGLWMERLTHLPFAFSVISAVVLMMTSAAAVYAYGEFQVIRWRLVASPADARRVLVWWVCGHLAAGAAVAVGVVGLLAPFFWGQLSATSPTSVARLGCAAALSMASGVVAGRLMPYDREDVFTLAGSATGAMVVFGIAWYALHGVALVPLAAIAAGCLAAALVALALMEEGTRR